MALVPTGIRRRHRRDCPGGDCRCSWEASVGSGRGPRLRRSFRTLSEARSWRTDAEKQLRRGEVRLGHSPKLRDAADALLDGMRDGSVRTRSGHRYKPSATRGYDDALRVHILPYLGARRLGDVKRRDVQALADRLVGAGKSSSTVRNALLPLRVIYRRALRDGVATVNPCAGVELPARDEQQRTPPTREDAEKLLAGVPDSRRAMWATALYGGLRLGELRALEWGDIDLAGGVIRVERSMDALGAVILPKSKAGRRSVPIAKVLRGILLEQRLRNGSSRYVFGRGDAPHPRVVPANGGFGLHACRHAYASFMIAAGVNAKTLSAYMGHSSITVTVDRYGHLFPGNEAEAAGLLDRYLAGGDAHGDARTRGGA
jgi:integrase